MDNTQFEVILTAICATLNEEIKEEETRAKNSAEFEGAVRRALAIELLNLGHPEALAEKTQGFPDIVVGSFGIEVKFTVENTWVSVANSIHESRRVKGVETIYVVFGKMGSGKVTNKNSEPEGPEVKWGKYEDVVYHARTSHRPRFQLDMKLKEGEGKESLFERLGTTYKGFMALKYEEKMVYMRTYARSRKEENIDFWWLEEDLISYAGMSDAKQREIRAEAALLVPGLVDTGDTEALLKMAMYMASTKRVLSHDSASVFGPNRLADFEALGPEIRAAAERLIPGLIEEYWKQQVEPTLRLAAWVQMVEKLSPGAAAVLNSEKFNGPA